MVMSVWLAEEFAPTSRDVVPADVMGRRCLGGSGNMDPGVPQALGQRFVEMLCEGWPQRAVAKRRHTRSVGGWTHPTCQLLRGVPTVTGTTVTVVLQYLGFRPIKGAHQGLDVKNLLRS